MTRNRRRLPIARAFAAGLLAAVFAAVPPARAEVTPARPGAPVLKPYIVQENPIIDGPASYWLVSASSPHQPATVIWCDCNASWAAIVSVNGFNLASQSLTDEQLQAYLFGRHGWPVRLVVKPRSGSARAIECFGGPNP